MPRSLRLDADAMVVGQSSRLTETLQEYTIRYCMYEYTPILKSILTSTIWSEPPYVRVVWLAMLLSADRQGRLGAAVPGIARISAVTVDEARDAIKRLESPDPDSRTPEFEGRRIEPIDGGWKILNYGKHREMLNRSGALSNERVKRYRSRCNAKSVACNDQDQEGKIKEEEKEEKLSQNPKPQKQAKSKKREPLAETMLPTDWQPTTEHVAFAEKHDINLGREVFKFRAHYDGKFAKSWNGKFATWLARGVDFKEEREEKQASLPIGSNGRPMISAKDAGLPGM